MATLLVAGIMIGYICSAVTDFVVTFAEDSDIVNLHGWSQGSFSGMNWSNVKVAVIVIGITILITFLMSKPIGTVSGKTQSRNFKTTGRDTCHLPRRRCLLYDV